MDCGGDGCNVYEEEDPPGCPDTDHWAGDMGPASKNCCYCKNPTVSFLLSVGLQCSMCLIHFHLFTIIFSVKISRQDVKQIPSS